MCQVNLAVTQHLPCPFSSPFLGDNFFMTMGSGSLIISLHANMPSPTFFCSGVGPGSFLYPDYARRILKNTAAVQFVH